MFDPPEARPKSRDALRPDTFHDLRHIATSRLARIFPNPLDLKRVTGHKDLKSLDRYYHTTAQELAARADVASHVVAGSWQTSNFHDPANPGCSIGGSASVAGGRLIMGASLKHPDPMVLVVRKAGWTMPAGTSVHALASFTDGTSIQLAGVGQGQAVQFDLAGQLLRDWVHELTSGAQMRLSFDGNEPVWSFDLAGTTTVVNAMGDCFKEHGRHGIVAAVRPG